MRLFFRNEFQQVPRLAVERPAKPRQGIHVDTLHISLDQHAHSPGGYPCHIRQSLPGRNLPAGHHLIDLQSYGHKCIHRVKYTHTSKKTQAFLLFLSIMLDILQSSVYI